MADGMSRDEAEYEYENNILPTIQEIEMETEKYDYDPSAKKKSKKKDTKVASLRSSKDKKFKGHTTYRT